MDNYVMLESEIKIEEEEIQRTESDDYDHNADVKITPASLPLHPKKRRRRKPVLNSKHRKPVGPPSNHVDKSWNEYLKLENSLQTYYCPECSFETKWKCYLKSHIKKIHASDSRIYHCKQCKFTTKWKFSLRNHMKVHSAPGTIKMHKCPKCDYQTKWNNGLGSHMKVHMLPKVMKVTIYKCTECAFECKNKLDLAQHKKMDHNPLQTVYKCPLCSFQTKFRHGVNKHVKIHNTAKKT